MEGLSSLIFLLLLFAVFYFMLIRPQRKRAEEHRRLVESIDVGDDVLTIGGVKGHVTGLGDEYVELEISPGTRVEFLKSAIARKVASPTGASSLDEAEGTSEYEGTDEAPDLGDQERRQAAPPEDIPEQRPTGRSEGERA